MDRDLNILKLKEISIEQSWSSLGKKDDPACLGGWPNFTWSSNLEKSRMKTKVLGLMGMHTELLQGKTHRSHSVYLIS